MFKVSQTLVKPQEKNSNISSSGEELLKEDYDQEEEDEEIEDEEEEAVPLNKANIKIYDSDINEIDSEQSKSRLKELYESNKKNNVFAMTTCFQCKDKMRTTTENMSLGPVYCMCCKAKGIGSQGLGKVAYKKLFIEGSGRANSQVSTTLVSNQGRLIESSSKESFMDSDEDDSEF
jgi:hypothetical protein